VLKKSLNQAQFSPFLKIVCKFDEKFMILKNWCDHLILENLFT